MHVLMSSPGAVVSKQEIIRRVWPTTLVEECNIRFQVATLRKALGEDRDLIKAVSGRGYLLAVEASAADPEQSDDARHRANPGAVIRSERSQPVTMSQNAREQAFGRLSLVAGGAPESYKALRDLLQAALDELWRITLQAS